MIVSEAMTQINMAYRGSDDDVPVAGTEDYTLWLGTINRKLSEWASDSKHTWSSIFRAYFDEPGTVATTGTATLTGTSTKFLDYQVGDIVSVDGETDRTIATITSDTVLTVTLAFTNTASGLSFYRKTIVKTAVTIYNLHRQFISPGSPALLVDSLGNITEKNIAKPQDLDISSTDMFIYGLNPQTISFVDDPDTGQVGCQLIVPGYFMPYPLVNATDIIPIDDPYWIVYAVASELAFNDLTYEAKTPALNAKANNLYHTMINNNRRGTKLNPRTVGVNVTRIPGVS
jgi:hypothetical protein